MNGRDGQSPGRGHEPAGSAGRRALSQQSDAGLLALLAGAAAEADPVPRGVVDAARASFTWGTLDSELAALAEDSEEDRLVGVRGAGGPRLLTFEAGPTTIVVQVTGAGPARLLLGQLLDPRAADIDVRHARGTTGVHADERGRFRLEGVPTGPVSLACTFAGPPARHVVTSWVSL